MDFAKKTIAVVTGANRGIGLETCRQLASNGIMVIMTARDQKKGIQAFENLRGSGLSNVIFHQLDVTDLASVASLADFIKAQFGKLDILVNNAGVVGVLIDSDALSKAVEGHGDPEASLPIWKDVTTPTNELTEECLQVNYYGVKQVTEALLPFLQLSDSPRIVNVSSLLGRLKHISNDWAKEVLSDGDYLTEERVEEVLNQFLEDFKEGSLETKGWPDVLSADIVSKAGLNAYTRILAKKFPGFHINCVCPGYVKTDITCHAGVLTVEEGAESVVRLALLPDDGPSGFLFLRSEESPF